MEGLQMIQPPDAETQLLLDEVRLMYSQKLWHNIADKLLALYQLPFPGELLLDVYAAFIQNFEEKINPLVLAKIVINITSRLRDQTVADRFVGDIIERLEMNKKAVVMGTLVLRSERAMCLLRVRPLQIESIKRVLEETEEMINAFGYVDSFVHAYFYRAQSIFFKGTGSFDEYYKSALRFLSYAELEDLPIEEQEKWAFDIGVAALVGEETFVFGELLQNRVIDALQSSETNAWMYNLLLTYNRGDVGKYKSLELELEPHFERIGILKQKMNYLQRKIQLMAIVELVFSREVNDRVLSFAEISKVTHCQIENVEFLLLRAMALHLVEGLIDQVAKTVKVMWVQPRILEMDQITTLREKLLNWHETVVETQNSLKQ